MRKTNEEKGNKRNEVGKRGQMRGNGGKKDQRRREEEQACKRGDGWRK